MIRFTVVGPLKIPYSEKNNVKRFEIDDVEEFWTDNEELRYEKGIYIFAISAGGGFTPYYVGKTARSFGVEAFSDRNISHFYNKILFEYDKGRPVMFFVSPANKKGPPPKNVIHEVETVLINFASRKNPDILNDRGTKDPRWSIDGVVRPGKGTGSKPSKELCRTLGLEK